MEHFMEEHLPCSPEIEVVRAWEPAQVTTNSVDQLRTNCDLSRGVDKFTKCFAGGNTAIPDQHGNFFIAALVGALDVYAGHVPESTLATWRDRLKKPLRDIQAENATNNWETYVMKGEWKFPLPVLLGHGERRNDHAVVPATNVTAERLDHMRQNLRAEMHKLVVTGCTAEAASGLRARANSLALRSTQAALTGSKGTGFLRHHPAQRWARQAMFFLVWSCPRPAAEATLAYLAPTDAFACL